MAANCGIACRRCYTISKLFTLVFSLVKLYIMLTLGDAYSKEIYRFVSLEHEILGYNH